METPQISQAIARAIGCSPQLDNKVLLQKTTLTYLLERREVELVPDLMLHSS